MQASFLLSVVGFTNVVGRVAIGAVSDRLGAYRIWLFIGCVMVCGLSTVLSVLSRTYAELQVYAATYGAAGGGFITLSSVVVVDMVGLDRLTNAYGLCLLCLGVAALVGPPLNDFRPKPDGVLADSLAACPAVDPGCELLFPRRVSDCASSSGMTPSLPESEMTSHALLLATRSLGSTR
ncbi:monocarboxylate transporter 3 [Dermacentor silvarum]|uniref:monocarboxylate transporter 3 n=1 Tax=Dermacentor silvarum TaxID=543639 RepID=UPI00189B1084|nr:monocarboxylate transporter 3 [Dermacentor silvarum]